MKKLILVIMSLVVVVLLGAAALGTFASSSPKEIKTIGESELTDNNNVDKPKFHPTRKVASATSFKDKMIFRLKGCKIMHEFDQATVIDCPPGLEIKNSRPEKMYYLTDMDSNIQISANKVWNLIDEDGENVTGKNVAVAVLDTGIDTSHEEFSQTLIINQKDFVNFDDTANDDHGHGTHVAGNIAAYGYRADAKGVAPGVDLMIGKVCSSSGCPEGAIVEGIQWAIDNDAQVISMSLGGGNYGGHCDDIGDLTVEAVNEAYAANIVVAVASGNDASGVSSPACASGAVAVGAVNTRDKIARFSNTGTALDVVAPGVEILSSYPCYLVPITTSIYYGCGDDPCASCVWYANMDGTSMATPHVSAEAALIMQMNPGWTAEQVKETIEQGSDDLGADGYDIKYGHGRINALNSVLYSFGCTQGDTQLCPKQDGVCAGSEETCSGGVWPGCDDTTYETYSPLLYETSETLCDDGLDNDCDGYSDSDDTDCASTEPCGDGTCSGYLNGEDCFSCPSDCLCIGPRCKNACCGNVIEEKLDYKYC